MFERFFAEFALTDRVKSRAESRRAQPLEGLFASLGGTTFDAGLYRIHHDASAALADGWVSAAFPEFAGLVACFGFDWLGRQFSLDSTSGTPDDPGVVLFDPGSGSALEIPGTFSTFHDNELVSHRAEALAADGFLAWGVTPVPFDSCAGYTIPLLLGGADDVSNLELTDLDVYWTMMGQLRTQTRDLPPGTSIQDIDIRE